MKPKRTISSYVLLVGMMSLLVVGSWLAYQIYASLSKSQITEKQASSIIPLEGSIQTEVINNLRGRRKFSEAELSSLVLNINVSSPSAVLR